MSLDYDLRDIRDRSDHFPPEEDGSLNRIVFAAIWATIPTGIGQINDDNVDEFYDRWTLWNAVTEHTSEYLDYLGLTREKVRHLSGLRTNAAPRTKSAFLKVIWDQHRRELKISELRQTAPASHNND